MLRAPTSAITVRILGVTVSLLTMFTSKLFLTLLLLGASVVAPHPPVMLKQYGPFSHVGPTGPPPPKRRRASLHSGIFEREAGTSCAPTLVVHTSGDPARTATFTLGSTECTGPSMTFSKVSLPTLFQRSSRYGSNIVTVMTSTLQAPLSCGTHIMPANMHMLYLRTEGTSVGHIRALLYLMHMGAPIRHLVDILRKGESRPGAYLAASTGCAWRRKGPIPEELELGNSEMSPEAVLSTKTPGNSIIMDTASQSEEKACFPGEAVVMLADGTPRRMSELRTGEVVRSAKGQKARVLMWTHNDATVHHRFVRIVTEDGRTLVLSHGHMLYVNGVLRAGASVRVGMKVEDDMGGLVGVSMVDEVMRYGLYNPQTEDGDIVVGGVRCSTYTTAVKLSTAHALLAPVRAVVRMFGGVAVKAG